jgi:GNAT superfamily N-acetyltransferase
MPSRPSDSIRRWSEGDYVVTDDPSVVDLDVVQSFLANDSYWAIGRTREQQARANELSTCFSALHAGDGEFVGFARVLSDDVQFGWVADVFVLEPHRGRGVAVFLMTCIVESFQHLPRLVLGTRDAHAVYERVGFRPIARVERWMERWNSPPNP